MRRLRPTIVRRFRHTARMPCQVVRERDFRLVSDSVRDLSETGMLVGPADPTLTGERVIVSFKLPSGGTWVDGEATVARVAHGRRPGEHSRCLGLQFEWLDARAQRALGDFLRYRPVIPPGHRPGRRSTKLALWALA